MLLNPIEETEVHRHSHVCVLCGSAIHCESLDDCSDRADEANLPLHGYVSFEACDACATLKLTGLVRFVLASRREALNKLSL